MSRRQLPGIIPFPVHESFISAFVSQWEQLCLESFYIIEQVLRSTVQQACDKHFGRFQTSGLLVEVNDVTSNLLDNAARHTLERIREYCRMENHRPFTMNTKEYAKSQKQRVMESAVIRHGDVLPSNGSSSSTFRLDDVNGSSRCFTANEDNLLRVLSQYGIHLSSYKELARIRPDEYDAELEVISHVEAYFDISSKRLIDDIPKVFETVFGREFGLDLAKVLTTDLKLVGARGLDNCLRYVRDEPDVQTTRDNLTRHLDILSKAVETVSRFFR